jgi:hypothetical protein
MGTATTPAVLTRIWGLHIGGGENCTVAAEPACSFISGILKCMRTTPSGRLATTKRASLDFAKVAEVVGHHSIT